MYDQTRAQQPADQPRGRPASRVPGQEPLLPPEGREEIVRRLGHAVNTFADSPREALEEAESAFDEAAAQLVAALAEQRKALRAGWQARDPEITQRLLRA
jgi:hypothetical protein